MRTERRALLAVALGVFAPCAAAAEMNPRFEPLRPMLGKTWRGSLAKPADPKPVVDVQRWELTLNGQAVRILHSINDGEYGGESVIVWDKERQTLAYWYFTTAGFYTAGTMAALDGALVSNESVKGDAGGITQVKGIHRLLPDGRLQTRTQFLKGGKWVDGRDAYYVEDRGAEVRFKE